MAKNEKRVKITLACEDCKRRNYITMKSKVNDRERIEMKKYCRWDTRHTVAEELVSQGAESAEALDRISAALDDLPAKLRSVVVLKDVYGMSHEAIADELGISVSAAKVRLHRARRKLRDVLYDEGVQANAV